MTKKRKKKTRPLLPPDISRCHGVLVDDTECPHKEECLRYLDLGNENSWTPPLLSVWLLEDGSCPFIWRKPDA